MISAGQCRAARGLLGWSQQDLATAARIGVVTVHQLENRLSQPRPATFAVIERAFEDAGIEFIRGNGGGPGVRLRNQPLKGGRDKHRSNKTRRRSLRKQKSPAK
jgi:transcriptional regulator with XRE-family HTH domain